MTDSDLENAEKVNDYSESMLASNISHIHGVGYEELKEQLSAIELQTKQTNADLEQLFDRLKNNNQNLNKLLESISNYSKEVITEGNATKHDVTRILEKLNVLPEGNLESIFQAHLEGSGAKIIKQITEIIQNENRIESSCKKILIDGQLSEIKNGLNNLSAQWDTASPSNKSLQDQVRDLGKTTEGINAKLMEIKGILEQQMKNPPVDEENLAARLKSLNVTLSESERLNLQKLIQDQANLLESFKQTLSRHVETQTAANTLEDLKEKYHFLQRKYITLTLAYEEKYNAFKKLEDNFQQLENKFDAMVVKVEGRDFQKYEKLQKLHVTKISDITNPPPFSIKKKRIISMPNRQFESQEKNQ